MATETTFVEDLEEAQKRIEVRMAKATEDGQSQLHLRYAVVRQGIELQVSFGEEYVTRLVPWFELKDATVRKPSTTLKNTEDFCLKSVGLE